MTNRRQSKHEAVIKKSLESQEKLVERAKTGNLYLTADVNVYPNPAAGDSSEQNSDEEVNLETIKEVEQELVDPNKTNMDKTEFNT